MTFEPTQRQSSEQLDQARSLSLERASAPADIPGYELLERLGVGAFGEVWTARDQNTGVLVAVKFYSHRASVDWAPVYREVEKLVLLSQDRHVVKLLTVGWTNDPPYYVMEYVAGGSLEQRLTQRGALPRLEATELFRELLVGMIRAHGRGVLHCDLKPDNILLDADQRPRIADFGQSRRSHEAAPALGTFFYMAPEQADLAGAPDARWDIYALGAILHSLLTGVPPHRTDAIVQQLANGRDLAGRLAIYRQHVASQPSVTGELRRRGIDRGLAALVARCLEPDPARRFATVQEVLAELEQVNRARARRPLLLLGAGGPLLLLVIVSLFAWRGYQRALDETVALAQRRSIENNRFAAELAAERATSEIADHYSTVEYEAGKQRLLEVLLPIVDGEPLRRINDPSMAMERLDETRASVRNDPVRQQLDAYLRYRLDLYAEEAKAGTGPQFASLFVVDSKGTMIGAAFSPEPSSPPPIGENFAHRSYFHGGVDETTRSALPRQDARPITHTHWSPVFQSSVTDERKVAISTPIVGEHNGREECLGVLVMTVRQENLRLFREPAAASENHFLVLVDDRPGRQRGTILVHPLLRKLLAEEPSASEALGDYRVPAEQLDEELRQDSLSAYRDPLGDHPAGMAWAKPWLAAAAPVTMPATDTGETTSDVDEEVPTRETASGLVVLVQEDLSAVTAPVRALAYQLVREGLAALAVVVAASFAWWRLVSRFTV
ncbi:MAG: serine/threonine protein kinase [Pirellulales bacterium]